MCGQNAAKILHLPVIFFKRQLETHAQVGQAPAEGGRGAGTKKTAVRATLKSTSVELRGLASLLSFLLAKDETPRAAMDHLSNDEVRAASMARHMRQGVPTDDLLSSSRGWTSSSAREGPKTTAPYI